MSHTIHNIKVTSVADLGLLIRATRKVRKLRQDELARDMKVGHVFVRDVEHGKPTVQMGKALGLLQAVGLELRVSVPEDVLAMRDALVRRRDGKNGDSADAGTSPAGAQAASDTSGVPSGE